MQDVPGQQPGHGLEPDVRMRRHLHPGDAVDGLRAVVIDEAPRPDAAAQPERQQPPHGNVTDPGLPRLGDLQVALLDQVGGDLDVGIDCAHNPILARPGQPWLPGRRRSPVRSVPWARSGGGTDAAAGQERLEHMLPGLIAADEKHEPPAPPAEPDELAAVRGGARDLGQPSPVAGSSRSALTGLAKITRTGAGQAG